VKWKNLQMPKRIQQIDDQSNERYGRFVIEPLERGFGETLGNALRRVLLSSLQGAAITSVRIDGALHEFTTLPGVLEDMSQIVLNLKQVRLRHHGDGERKGYFKVSGEREVKAADMEIPPDVEILNPEQHIATLNAEGNLEVEIEIMPGRGYVSADQHIGHDRPIGVIPIDALFSPVTRVNFEVEQTRIGQRIDYDKLMLDVWTDGSIAPQDGLSMGAKILRDHFALLINFEEEFMEERTEEVDEEVSRLRQMLSKSVDELELSVRSSNCLRAAKVRTLGELVQKTEQEMLKQRNFGRKSLKEIEDILVDMGLRFGMDVSEIYGGAAPAAKPAEVAESAGEDPFAGSPVGDDMDDNDDEEMDDDDETKRNGEDAEASADSERGASISND
jgi:DNA-directed RNA polymerase subunit alpha